VAWLGLIEADSILIREKRKHLSKMSDRVSKNVLGHKRLRVESREGFIEVFISIIEVYSLSYTRTLSIMTVVNATP
jgi:hypothetical protein